MNRARRWISSAATARWFAHSYTRELARIQSVKIMSIARSNNSENNL